MGTIANALKEIQKSIEEHSVDHTARLVCVSKRQSVRDIMEVYAAGVRDFGESRVQELVEKQTQLPGDIRWHFIGSLQTNKVRKIIGHVHLIHSVDSQALLEKIAAVSCEMDVVTSVLLQVNTSHEQSKHGFFEDELMELFPTLFRKSHIKIIGLMTMAAERKVVGDDAVRLSFQKLALLRKKLETYFSITLPELSMGMSQDYLLAIQEDATLLRIGSSIFRK